MTSPYYLANAARKKALEIQESKFEPKTAPRLDEVANELFDIRKKKLATKTHEKDLMRFKKYVLPFLSNRKIDEIQRQDVACVI